MKIRDFDRMQDEKVTEYEIKENLLALEILHLFQEKNPDYSFNLTGNYLNDLLYLYFSLKDNGEDDRLNTFMDSFNFNYHMAIHNAIYYLLGKPSELSDVKIDPLLWAGVYEINKDGNEYQLNTKLGLIKVMKARPLFSKTSSNKIFRKQLMGQCHERTMDFLKENPDYQAVLAYMPNFFLGGHYHSYLEKDGCILDIASNAFYNDFESIQKIFNGRIIKKVSYKQAIDKFEQLKQIMPDIPNKQKLLTLSLYYDMKNKN